MLTEKTSPPADSLYTQRNIFYLLLNQPESDCIYHFPVDLTRIIKDFFACIWYSSHASGKFRAIETLYFWTLKKFLLWATLMHRPTV